MSTFTASVLGTPPTNHTGLQVVVAHAGISATGTAGSIVKFVRLPQGAVIHNWMITGSTAGADQTLELGTSNTASGIMAVFSTTGTSVMTPVNAGTANRLPLKISLSDDVEPRSVWIEAKIGAAISASAQYTLTLFYTTDGGTGRTNIR